MLQRNHNFKTGKIIYSNQKLNIKCDTLAKYLISPRSREIIIVPSFQNRLVGQKSGVFLFFFLRSPTAKSAKLWLPKSRRRHKPLYFRVLNFRLLSRFRVAKKYSKIWFRSVVWGSRRRRRHDVDDDEVTYSWIFQKTKQQQQPEGGKSQHLGGGRWG